MGVRIPRWTSHTDRIRANRDQRFYGEGPGGGHFQNIVGPYTQIGCGIYVDASGITIVEDFR